MKNYGITNKSVISKEIDYHIENIKIKGYSIFENAIHPDICDEYAEYLEVICKIQEEEFGKEKLELINELDMARMAFLYNKMFTTFFTNQLVLELTSSIIGNNFHLHLQNGIINRPQKEHHQTSWHRDLPYQDWIISKPLAFNAFYCLSDFNSNNGATYVLPYSHNLDFFPSDKYVKENELQVIAPKGSIIFFNSMLYHRAGINSSNSVRYGLNNMFVVPILKQQINLNQISKNHEFTIDERKIIGENYLTPNSVIEFRENRFNRNKLKR